MTCIVCHRSVGTRAKKCHFCGSPTALSKGEFLFEMSASDKSQLNRYYQQAEEKREEESSASIETHEDIEVTEAINQSTNSSESNYSSIPSVSKVNSCGTTAERFWIVLSSVLMGVFTPSGILFAIDTFLGNCKIIASGFLLWFWTISFFLAIPTIVVYIIWFKITQFFYVSYKNLFRKIMILLPFVLAVTILIVYFCLPAPPAWYVDAIK